MKPTRDEIETAYATLDVPPGASPAIVKDAYRDLVREWHPDRFNDDPRRHSQAESKLKAINHAIEVLEWHFANGQSDRGRKPKRRKKPRKPKSRSHATLSIKIGLILLFLIGGAVLAGRVVFGIFEYEDRRGWLLFHASTLSVIATTWNVVPPIARSSNRRMVKLVASLGYGACLGLMTFGFTPNAGTAAIAVIVGTAVGRLILSIRSRPYTRSRQSREPG